MRLVGEDTARQLVSIPVLVNLRLGVPGRPDDKGRQAPRVSIPVLVNLRLGDVVVAECLKPSSGLNSCSGEPAARGEDRREGRRRHHYGVSIPVLVNLRLGEDEERHMALAEIASQFLFW